MLRYIFGGPGSGKSYLCAEEIAEAQREQSDEALIYIVPEQFSLSAEALLLNHAKGLFRARVLSFNRLAYAVIQEVGRGGLLALDDLGKHLLIRKALNRLKGRLRYYKTPSNVFNKGFVKKIGTLLSEFHQYGVNADSLRDAAAKNNNAALLDLADIFEEYLAELGQRFNTYDTTLDILSDKLPLSNILKGAKVWLDGFKSFTPQEMKVITGLLSVCGQVTAVFTLDEMRPNFDGYFYNVNEYEPFSEIKQTVNEITALGGSDGAAPSAVFLRTNHRHINSESLEFLTKNFFAPNSKPNAAYADNTDSITFSRFGGIYEELDHTARQIVSLCRDDGYKWNEIGVVVSDLSLYRAKMRMIFARYGIGLFIDYKRGLPAHPLAEVCRGFFALSAGGLTYINVFRLLKTGLMPFLEDEVNLLENYCLALGIKGRIWEKEWPWTLDGDETAKMAVNSLRERFLGAVSPFLRRLRKKNIASKDICKVLYDFLEGTGAAERFFEWIETARSEDLEQAKTHEGIWAKLVEILDVTAGLFGDEHMTAAEFAGLLETGFESVSAGLAPPSLDHVIAGDISRSRLANVRALFVLGFNDALVPSVLEEGLLSDVDREMLAKNKVKVAGTIAKRALDERLNIYQVLCKPSEKLFLSCLDDKKMGGETLLLKEILRKMPGISANYNHEKRPGSSPGQAPRHGITSAEPMLYTIFSRVKEEPENAELQAAYNILKTHGCTKPYENINKENRLTDDMVVSLYGKGRKRLSTTVTRLENYNQCPFMYFGRNVLGLKERRLYEIENHDIGNLLHRVLERFTKSIIGKDKAEDLIADVNSVTDEIERLVDETAAESQTNILMRGSRAFYFKKRLREIALKSALVMREHLSRSGFDVAASEAEFGVNEPFYFALDDGSVVTLSGRIDRVDIARLSGRELVSVVDYKTGSGNFSFVDTLHGLRLQLVVYLMAILKELGEPAGIMYFKVGNPAVDYSDEIGEHGPERAIFEKFRLSGTVLSDIDVIGLLDKSAEEGNVLPVSITKQGAISARTPALDGEGFNALMEHAAKCVRELGAAVLSGDVSANPLKHRNRTPCAYCGFAAICGFKRDEAGKYRQTRKLSEKEALEIILRGEEL